MATGGPQPLGPEHTAWSSPPPGRGRGRGGGALGLPPLPSAVRKALRDPWHSYVHYIIFPFPQASEAGMLVTQGGE